MKEGSKKAVRLIISVVLIAVSFYFALKDINFGELVRIIIHADYLWIILSIPIILLSHWVRAMRWKTLLEPALNKKSASIWNLFSAVMIGYAGNCVLPRGGEVLRPLVYSRREKISFTTTFATVIAERFIDVIALFFLFVGVFFFLSGKVIQALPELDPNKIMIPTTIIFFVIVFSFYPPFVRFILRKILKPISEKFYNKISHAFDKFMMGFAVIKKPSQYFRLSIESFAIWLFYTIPMWLMFYSFGFESKFHLGFSDATVLIVVSGIGATIAPTPGTIGVYHFLIQNAMMKLYGISSEEALAYATLTHAVNYIIQLGVGGLFFFHENIKQVPPKEELANEIESISVETG